MKKTNPPPNQTKIHHSAGQSKVHHLILRHLGHQSSPTLAGLCSFAPSYLSSVPPSCFFVHFVFSLDHGQSCLCYPSRSASSPHRYQSLSTPQLPQSTKHTNNTLTVRTLRSNGKRQQGSKSVHYCTGLRMQISTLMPMPIFPNNSNTHHCWKNKKKIIIIINNNNNNNNKLRVAEIRKRKREGTSRSWSKQDEGKRPKCRDRPSNANGKGSIRCRTCLRP